MKLQRQGVFSLLGHPGGVLKGQLSAANLLLAEVNVLPELGDGIQRSVVLETQAADLQWGEPEVSQSIEKWKNSDF